MAEDYSGAERRQHERVKVNFTVVYQVDKPLEFSMMIGNKLVDALMLDLSESGMSVLTTYNLPIGAELLIKFTLIGAHPYYESRSVSMNVTGEVRNNIIFKREERRLGVLFTKISEQDRGILVGFVQKIHQ